MREIQLTQGYKALVDDEDYERVSQFKWLAVKNKRKNTVQVYAMTTVWIPKWKKSIALFLHHFILSYNPKGLQVDHIDRNTLNNQKQNLRHCTNTENNYNKPKGNFKNNYKGVHYYAERNKFRVNINVNKKYIFIGYFDDEIEAAKAYNEAAIKYHGEFACLNII